MRNKERLVLHSNVLNMGSWTYKTVYRYRMYGVRRLENGKWLVGHLIGTGSAPDYNGEWELDWAETLKEAREKILKWSERYDDDGHPIQKDRT